MRDDQSLRVPPHSLEAEQSILGGLMLDNTGWDRAADLLAQSDFYRHEHQVIYAAIGRLVNACKPADVLTVCEELGDKAGDVGGLPYLNALAQSVPSAANIRRYAEIVAERSLHRALIAAADQALSVAWSEDRIAAERLDQIGSIFAKLEGRGISKEPAALGDLVVRRLDHYTQLYEGTTAPGIPTGFASLDRALGGGLKPGKVIVLGARPTVGKTSKAGQIATNVAATGHSVLVFSQEMTAGELTDRFVANAANVSLERLSTGQLSDEDWSRVSEAAQRLSTCPLFVDDTPALTLHQVRGKARQVRRKHGLALIVLDYLQLMSGSGTAERRHHQIEAISRGLKQLAKELDVCILVLSQLNRSSTDRPGGEPEMSDLKESGAAEEDADVVLLLHPMGNEGDGTLLMLLKLAKNRQGRRGRLALSFDGKTQRWRESSANVDRRV